MSNFSHPLMVRHRDAPFLADSVAHRLAYSLADTQAERGEATVVLTGGTIGIKILERLASVAARELVDWSAVNFWWSDERFVAGNSPERNSVQAFDALLNRLPVNAQRVHQVISNDNDATVADASRLYSERLKEVGEIERKKYEKINTVFRHSELLPIFDILLLGMGPDAHVASLFPGTPGSSSPETLTIAVTASPKPPPQRVSFTLPVINTAREVWFVVSGTDKADALARSFRADAQTTDIVDVPASGVSGREKTMWLVDEAAAAKIHNI